MQALGTLLILVGFAAMGVALWGLIRGHVTWLNIPSRKMAGAVLAGSMVVMGIGGAMNPAEDEVSVAADGATTTTAAPTAKPTTTTAKPTTTTAKPATTTTTRPPATTTTRLATTTTTTVRPTTATTDTVGAPRCDSHYPDHCIPPAPPDLDCPEIPYTNFRVVGGDPHRFDADKDGIGCEAD